jgi:hypothetical protein
MKIQFLTASDSSLAEENPALLDKVKGEIHARAACVEVADPAQADAIVVHEATSFKEWRYIEKLRGDPIIGQFPHKTYTINTDDSAAGLLRGLYTSLGAPRFDARFHRAIPFPTCLNERVLERRDEVWGDRRYLASWRGNTRSNPMRKKLIDQFAEDPRFRIEATDSWFNHGSDEKNAYVDLLLFSKFSLCPAGWASVSFRIYESMALGIAPVILANDFVPPAGPDWPSFALIFKDRQLPKLETLLMQKEGEYRERGRLAKIAWNQFFNPDVIHGYYADSLLDCIRSAPAGSRDTEFKRWSSFRMHWTNRWTALQRLGNKFAKLRR